MGVHFLWNRHFYDILVGVGIVIDLVGGCLGDGLLLVFPDIFCLFFFFLFSFWFIFLRICELLLLGL